MNFHGELNQQPNTASHHYEWEKEEEEEAAAQDTQRGRVFIMMRYNCCCFWSSPCSSSASSSICRWRTGAVGTNAYCYYLFLFSNTLSVFSLLSAVGGNPTAIIRIKCHVEGCGLISGITSSLLAFPIVGLGDDKTGQSD